ncbi:MAG: hypothetical protein WBX15_20890 [Thermoanaerobaculia bacterium]
MAQYVDRGTILNDRRVLLVDSDPVRSVNLGKALTAEGLVVERTKPLEGCCDRLDNDNFRVLIVDPIDTEEASSFLECLDQRHPEMLTRLIFIADPVIGRNVLLDLLKRNIYAIFSLPFEFSELGDAARDCASKTIRGGTRWFRADAGLDPTDTPKTGADEGCDLCVAGFHSRRVGCVRVGEHECLTFLDGFASSYEPGEPDPDEIGDDPDVA